MNYVQEVSNETIKKLQEQSMEAGGLTAHENQCLFLAKKALETGLPVDHEPEDGIEYFGLEKIFKGVSP